MRAAALMVALASSAAVAAERFDHRGAVGLIGAVGDENRVALYMPGYRLDAELGGTWAVGYDGNELMLSALGSLGAPFDALTFEGGYRGYYGYDRIRTFVDLQLAVDAIPAWSVGPRVGFGVQYEVAPIAGVFAAIHGQLSFGQVLNAVVSLQIGFQLRSYLLEG